MDFPYVIDFNKPKVIPRLKELINCDYRILDVRPGMELFNTLKDGEFCINSWDEYIYLKEPDKLVRLCSTKLPLDLGGKGMYEPYRKVLKCLPDETTVKFDDVIVYTKRGKYMVYHPENAVGRNDAQWEI